MMPTKPTTNPRYIILRARNSMMLAAEVDPKLQDGVWECAGGPFFDHGCQEWCQAIIRPVRDLMLAPAKAVRTAK